MINPLLYNNLNSCLFTFYFQFPWEKIKGGAKAMYNLGSTMRLVLIVHCDKSRDYWILFQNDQKYLGVLFSHFTL